MENKAENKAQKLMSFISNNLGRVAKMEKQLSELEANKLILKYGFEQTKIMLAKMNNWKAITKRVSVYLTVIHWFDLDNKKAPDLVTTNTDDAQEKDLAKRKQDFEAKYPVGSSFEYNNIKYKVTALGVLSWGYPVNFITTAMFLQNSIFQP